MPFRITYHTPGNQDVKYSLDSYLTALFSDDCGPEDAWFWYSGTENPYRGCDTEFSVARANGQTLFEGNRRMRYLVCRLDMYDDVIDPTSYGNIPHYVKRMIDDSARSAGQTGTFVIDKDWNPDPDLPAYTTYSGYPDAQAALLQTLDSSQVLFDATAPVTYLGLTGVMGYTSFGMHDRDIVQQTMFGRPGFTWQPGSIATINESGALQQLHSPQHAYGFHAPVATGDVGDPRELNVYVYYQAGNVRKNYVGYVIKLYDQVWPNPFITQATVDSTGLASFDLESFSWPTSHQIQIRLFYPPDDIYHAVELVYWGYGNEGTAVWNNFSAGKSTSVNAYLARQCSGEYICEGASAVIGAVSEPYIPIAHEEYLFPMYVKGYGWAESAYMSADRIMWKCTVLGDPLMAPYGCASGVKQKKDGVSVTTSPLIATVASGVVGTSICYVQSQDRVTGIRVQTTDTVTEGDLVSVSGTLGTNSDGERVITSATVRSLGAGTPAKPLDLVNRDLGGGDWNYNSSTGAGQQGMTGRVGLNNIGLLVRTTGCVSDSNDTAKTFNIDDGSFLGPIKVAAPSTVTVPSDGTYVGVTGLSSCETQSGNVVPVLLTRCQDDRRDYGECSLSGGGSRGNAPNRSQPEEPIGEPTDTVAWALSQNDGTPVTVKACSVLESSSNGLVISDGWISGAASIRVPGNWAVDEWSTVDVTGAVTTLPDRTRAITAKQVLIYTASMGRPFTFPLPWLRNTAGQLVDDWPYKRVPSRRSP